MLLIWLEEAYSSVVRKGFRAALPHNFLHGWRQSVICANLTHELQVAIGHLNVARATEKLDFYYISLILNEI